MSRSAAAALEGLIAAATSLQPARKRAMTLARLIARLEEKGAHEIVTPRGRMKALASRGPHLAAAALGFMEEEPEQLAWIDAEVKPGQIYWDIGAATGLFAMYVALKRDVKVVAFEPKGSTYGVLVEHLALNGLGDQIQALPLALSDTTTLTSLGLSHLAAGSAGNSLGGAPDQFGQTHSVFNQAAMAFRIDDLRRLFNLPAPDHIKLDVDGIEGAILRGGPETLPLVRTILIEVEGDNAREAESRIEAPLKAAGFTEDLAVRAAGSKRNRLYRNTARS